MRNAVQEIGGAVERVDDPAVALVGARDGAAFLAEKAVIRPRLGEFLAHDLLGAAVGGGDEIARPFDRHLQMLDLAEIALEAAPGAMRRFDHDIENCGDGSWDVSVRPGAGADRRMISILAAPRRPGLQFPPRDLSTVAQNREGGSANLGLANPETERMRSFPVGLTPSPNKSRKRNTDRRGYGCHILRCGFPPNLCDLRGGGRRGARPVGVPAQVLA